MNQVIESYESISAITAQMREAAARSEWDKLTALELQCRERVATMKNADAATPTLDEQARKRKVELIHRILDDDAAIRGYTEPWMAQLQRIMQNTRTEQRVKQAYSGGGL